MKLIKSLLPKAFLAMIFKKIVSKSLIYSYMKLSSTALQPGAGFCFHSYMKHNNQNLSILAGEGKSFSYITFIHIFIKIKQMAQKLSSSYKTH
jgi:hypothetical protein